MDLEGNTPYCGYDSFTIPELGIKLCKEEDMTSFTVPWDMETPHKVSYTLFPRTKVALISKFLSITMDQGQ